MQQQNASKCTFSEIAVSDTSFNWDFLGFRTDEALRNSQNEDSDIEPVLTSKSETGGSKIKKKIKCQLQFK